MSWWENYKNDFIKMLEFIKSIKQRKDLKLFFDDYKIETMIRMVFESNTIENEGLDLTGTKRLFSEILEPQLIKIKSGEFKSTEEKKVAELFAGALHNLTDVLNITDYEKNKIVLYKDKKKEFTTTLNHLIVMSAIDISFRNIKKDIEKYEDVFNAKILKEYHGHLSKGLNNNNNGEPGEYRIDGAYIDMNTIFLQPSLISDAIDNAFSIFLSSLSKGKNMYLETMLLVAKFIKIHPFGDCNGRLSRIILNLAFLYDEVPFYLVLRSNSRDKKKYIEAMREYYQNKKISKFISVVSRTFLKQIEEINSNLELAGKEQIEPIELERTEKEKILKELEEF